MPEAAGMARPLEILRASNRKEGSQDMLTSTQDHSDKRKHPRMQVDYEVFSSCQGQTFISRTRDVSPQGIGLYAREPLAPGSPSKLTVILPERALSLELWGTVCHCSKNPDQSRQPFPFLAGIELSPESKEDFPFLQIQGQILHYAAAHSLTIEAPRQDCYRLICDFERYPVWEKTLEQAKVLDRYPDGRGRRVEFVVNAYFRKARYLLEYSYHDSSYCLSWISAGGDIRSISGRYFFQPLGENRSSATYELDVTVDFPLPNRIIRYFASFVMRRSMKNLKAYVEKTIQK